VIKGLEFKGDDESIYSEQHEFFAHVLKGKNTTMESE